MFLWELICDLFHDLIYGDWVERILMSVILICFLSVFAMLGLLGYCIADYAFTQEKATVGVVSGKHYEFPYTTYVLAGKVLVPVHHPEQWVVGVRTQDNQAGSINISQTGWDGFRQGDKLNIVYSSGRFSGSLSIKSIQKRE